MFKNMVQRADRILPPGLPGYNKNLSGIPFDVNKSKQLIAQSKYGSVANLPPITITTEGEGGGVSGMLEAIAYQWKQNLGLDVTIRAIEQERYIFHLHDEVDNMYDFGWIADYPHPQNFLDVLFHTGADNNYGGYSNQAVDALLDQAGTTQDVNASLALYQQAEQKLVNDAATLPLFFSRNYELVKPYVHGYALTPLGFVMLNNVSVDSH
jgi:oligopeptide transport system substrate-binding protein